MKCLSKLVFGPVFRNAPQATAKEWTDALTEAQSKLETLAGLFDTKFLAGNHLTIADLQVFFEISLFVLMLNFDLSTIPKVAQWHHDCTQSPELSKEWNEYKTLIVTKFEGKLPSRPAETDTIEFYHTPLSQPSAAVKTILDIAGAKYNIHIINLLERQHKSEDYLKVHPLGIVPSIVFNGHSMVESGSIMRFLADKYELTHLYPKDAHQRQHIDQMFDYNGTTLRTSLSGAWRKHVSAWVTLFGAPASSEEKKSTYNAAIAQL